MSQDKWDDHKIEDLLSNVPKVKDTRTKDEILQRLKNDGVFDDQPSKTMIKQKKKRNWIPPLVTVAAIALIAIMIPSMMNQLNGGKGESTSFSMETAEETENMKSFSNEATESNDTSEMGIMSQKESTANLKTAVYPEDLNGYTVFHLGLPSDQAESIPFTILIPTEQVIQDLGKENPTGVELYNYYAPLIDESAYGFQDYHPYKGIISENGNRVIHTLPVGHGYDMASGSMGVYSGSLIDTFKTYEEVVFVNEDGSPVEFDQVGEVSEPLQIHSDNTQFNYYKHIQSNGSEFLSTNGRRSVATIQEALEGMKVEDNDLNKTVILPGVDYTVSVNGSTVTVAFTSELDLLSFDQVDAMQMIEGILLTAASFNMEVIFENIVQTNWGGFDFTKPLPIPVGPNKVPLLIK